MTTQVVKVGAVSYDPKVVTIWEGMREYFQEAGLPTDYVLFSNYEAQVDALLKGQIDLAWNTNVAYIRSQQRAGGQCRILAMRNTDVDFTTRLVARSDSGIVDLPSLVGKRVSLGSPDSAQAAILPLFFIRGAGLNPELDMTITSFNLDLGKHGDTGSSELEVLRSLHEGRADAGAIGHVTWLRELEMGHVNSGLIKSVWTSPPYSHCNFTARPDFDHDLGRRWTEILLNMDYNHPRWRRIMELEGLTAWVPGRQEGYEIVAAALGKAAPRVT